MTSAEIKATIDAGIKIMKDHRASGLPVQSGFMRNVWLSEIAYQLAVANERDSQLSRET